MTAVRVGGSVTSNQIDAEALLRQAEEELRYRVGLERIVTEMSTRLVGVHLDDLPGAVEEGLAALCNHFAVDRAYALKVDHGFVFDLNVEWWAPGIERRTTPVTQLPPDAQRYWVRALRSGTVVHIPDVDVDVAEPEADAAVAALRRDGVQSILFLPLLARGVSIGFLGFEGRRTKRRWSDESIALMRTVGELFVSAVGRSRAEQALATTALELERRNQELERSNADLEQFASIVSHDLKSPLQVVRGFLELLSREMSSPTPNADVETYVAAALRGAERMDRLIEDLLTYSRAGQRPTEFVAVDLNHLLGEVLADSATLIAEADADVVTEPLPIVSGDGTQLRQLLQNLVSNAIKFRSVDEPAKVYVRGGDAGDEWLVRVEDNGIGIEAQHREEIFAMFSRVHQVDRPGSGIGLAVCERVVANHGGRIWVEDRPGGGTSLCFTLSKHPDGDAG